VLAAFHFSSLTRIVPYNPRQNLRAKNPHQPTKPIYGIESQLNRFHLQD